MTPILGQPGLFSGLGELEALPSASAAEDLIGGKPGALARVIGTTALRAGLIGGGLLLAGQRRGVIKGAVYASLAIEAFVLAWTWNERPQT